MYTTDLPTKAGISTGYASPVNEMEDPSGQPLSLEIMSRLSGALDKANHASAELYDLRNRLFGNPPETQSLAPGARVSPSGFTEAYRDRARDLEATLETIDRLSSELAGRI